MYDVSPKAVLRSPASGCLEVDCRSEQAQTWSQQRVLFLAIQFAEHFVVGLEHVAQLDYRAKDGD